MNTILAIDQGTHASRALLFDQYGNILKSSKQPLPIFRKKHGVVEQDAMQILGSVQDVINNVLTHTDKQRVTAALATQRSTLVAWNSHTGKPLAPAISWQDHRCSKELDDLKVHQTRIHQITGLPLSPHYLAGKIRWLLKHHEAVINARHSDNLMVGSLSSFLCFHLLEKQPFIIDHSNAARSLLFDIEQLDWSTELLQLFDIPRSILPECVPVLSAFGQLREHNIPLGCVCGDQNAVIHANGEPRVEDITINIGTGAFILQPQGHRAQHHDRLVTSIADSSLSHTHYLLEGTVNGAGSALSELQKKCSHVNLLTELPRWLSETDEPPIILNTTAGIGSPWWMNQLDNRHLHTCKDLTLQSVALVESIVFMLQHNLQLMKTSVTRSIHISGGLSQLDGLCQKIADLSKYPVIRFEENEATATGAAWLVTLADKKWLTTKPAVKFTPACNPTLEQRYKKYTDALLAALGKNADWYQDNSLHLTQRPAAPAIVAHRGYQKHYPENTLESVMAAIKAGTHCVEVDIQFSQDNIPVVFHDESLVRTTGIDGCIFDYTYEQLRKLDANEQSRLGKKFKHISIPTLNELLDIINRHQHIHFFIEIKQQTLDKFGTAVVMTKILTMLEPHAEHCTIISFNIDCLEFIKQSSSLSIGWVLRQYDQEHFNRARQLQPDYLICNHEKLQHTRPEAGPWQWMLYEVNTAKLADKLFKSGVNYISTADVSALIPACKTRGNHETI